ncbi:cellulose synthase [Nonomuraea sp. NPDC050556]|uniref:cellulose synthase n=1 Tax=Nonomuraea sp. NPDC050556 TaxID=3364369 RepID=UPI00378EDF14
MPFESITWLPICGGLTAVGLVFSFLAFRRRGAAAGMRLAAWSLLPVAALLTGALSALWVVGSTIVGFVTSLVFNPVVWAGVAVTGLSVVLFVVSGVMRARKLARADAITAAPAAPAADKPGRAAPARPVQQPAGKPAVAPPKSRTNDDDFSDIEDILKKRGIS